MFLSITFRGNKNMKTIFNVLYNDVTTFLLRSLLTVVVRILKEFWSWGWLNKVKNGKMPTFVFSRRVWKSRKDKQLIQVPRVLTEAVALTPGQCSAAVPVLGCTPPAVCLKSPCGGTGGLPRAPPVQGSARTPTQLSLAHRHLRWHPRAAGTLKWLWASPV